MALSSKAQTPLLRLKWRRAFSQWEIKLRLWVEAAKAGFDPNQPRVPAGNPDGGQWTRTGGSGGQILSDANPDNFWKPGSQLAQVRRPAAGRVKIGGTWHPVTPAQETRLSLAEARSQTALRRVREIDPNWQPRPSFERTVEGRIRTLNSRARQADARLRELGQKPPEQLIQTYRTLNNSRDLFGNPTWRLDRDTVAIAVINHAPIAGVNSRAPTYTTRDRAEAQRAVDRLVRKYPETMNTINLGGIPNNALYHAEATLLLRAARANHGTLRGQKFRVRTDREMCLSCRDVLPLLTHELGSPTVTFVSPSGMQQTIRNGAWVD